MEGHAARGSRRGTAALTGRCGACRYHVAVVARTVRRRHPQPGILPIQAMVDPANLLAIILMASVTYLTRIGGYILLRNRSLSPRAMAVLEAEIGSASSRERVCQYV